jgi:hypothetical protein
VVTEVTDGTGIRRRSISYAGQRAGHRMNPNL